MVVVSTAISIGSVVVGSLTGLTAAVAAFAYPVASALVGFLAQAAIGFALNALTPKPKVRGANRGYQINTRGSALDHQIIYGEARVGGVIIFEESVEGQTDNPDVDNQFLLRVYAHAGHEVEGYKEVYIDGKKVTEWRRGDNDAQIKDSSGNVTSDLTKASPPIPNGTTLVPYTVCDVRTDGTVIGGACNNRYAFDYLVSPRRSNNMLLRFYDGTQTTADGSLIADSDGKWDADCVLNNTAYMVATMGFLPDVFPNGVPEITCTIKGKKCFDPRNGTTTYTQNPAICIRDYLTNDYGLNEDSTNIDDDLVVTAANVCDEFVEAGINRYTCKGSFVTSVQPADILADLLTSMGGLLWYSQGKWRMKPAYWTPPSITLTEDDLRSNISVKTRHSRRDNFNVVKGTFRGPSTNWQVTDYPEVPVPGSNPFLTVDGGEESVVDLDLPFTDNPLVARRIARIFLERNRQQLTISGSFGLRAFGLQIGDNVNLTLERFGWVEKTFEVNSWTFGLTDNNDLQVQMTLREISENVFDEVDDGAVFELDNTNLPDLFLTETPTNLTALDSGFINTDGTFVSSIAVSWNVVKDPVVNYYVFEWKKSTATEYNSVDLDTKNYEIPGVEDGVQYDIRVKSVNTVGVSSDYAFITFTPGSDTAAPGIPTNFGTNGGYNQISVEWTNPTDSDLREIEVYSNPSNTFVGATLIGKVSGTEFVHTGLSESQTVYYFLKAVDYSGNKSAFSSGVSGTTLSNSSVGVNSYTGKVYYQTLQGTAPATPTADSYDPSTGEFTNLTANWATTQPSVEITDTSVQEWSSSFEVEVNNATASQTVSFTTPTGAIQVTSNIESDNFVAGSSGWSIERDTGNAEFGAAVIRGELEASQISIGDSSLSADNNGSLVVQGGNITVLEDNFYTASLPIDGDGTFQLAAGNAVFIPPGFEADLQIVVSFGHGYSNLSGNNDSWAWSASAGGPDVSIPVEGGLFNSGTEYTIIELNNTDWNALAGTSGITYSVGDVFTTISTLNGISVSDLVVGVSYEIADLGNTTQSNWNTIAGTSGVTYEVGDVFECASTGTGTGTVDIVQGNGVARGKGTHIINQRRSPMIIESDYVSTTTILKGLQNDFSVPKQFNVFIDWYGESSEITLGRCDCSIFLRFK